MRQFAAFLFGFVCIFSSTLADEPVNQPPTFSAVCEDDKVIGYRYETDMSGTPITHGWDEESFSGPWIFVYEGGDMMLVDDEIPPCLGSILYPPRSKGKAKVKANGASGCSVTLDFAIGKSALKAT